MFFHLTVSNFGVGYCNAAFKKQMIYPGCEFNWKQTNVYVSLLVQRCNGTRHHVYVSLLVQTEMQRHRSPQPSHGCSG